MTRRTFFLASTLSLLPLPTLARQKAIRLTGTVLYSYSECDDLILRVTQVTLPSGETLTLSPPRAKRIVLSGLDSPPVLDEGASLTVLGVDRGRGRALEATRWEQEDSPAALSNTEISSGDESDDSSLPPPALLPTLTLDDGTRIEGKRLLTLTATGYGPGENGQWGDKTKLGTTVGYGTVAVDPRVIPLRTRLYVEDYGFCIALDVGGAIKGLRIDLGHDTDEAAALVGRVRRKVLVLG